MFTSIKTSKKNKEVVSFLTRKLNLGTENIISRIAFCYSISKVEKFELSSIQDSQGKEYSKSVLFGTHINYYLSLVSVKYNLYITDKDIPKYIKIHIDNGLELIYNEVMENPNLDGFDFVIEKIENGLEQLIVG